MKSKISIVVVLFVGLATTIFAIPNGEMKSSPLFKASLKNSIAKLEGENSVQEMNSKTSGEMATTKPGCVTPNALHTQISTCEPSYCGSSETCLVTSCYGSTCYSTCQSTCTNTCQGQGNACPYHYIWKGTNYWNYQGSREHDWSHLHYYGYSFSYGITKIGCYDDHATNESTAWGMDGTFSIDKWYSYAITTRYNVVSDAYLYSSLGSIIQEGILHNLSAPNATGYGHIVDICF